MNNIFENLNWLHVLVATIGYFAVGSLWYSPVLFAKRWIRYTGIDITNPNVKKGVAQIMLGSILLMAICCTGLAILTIKLGITNWKEGITLGLLTGICFSFTAISISLIYEKKPLGLHLINGGYNIVGNVVAALILSSWQ